MTISKTAAVETMTLDSSAMALFLEGSAEERAEMSLHVSFAPEGSFAKVDWTTYTYYLEAGETYNVYVRNDYAVAMINTVYLAKAPAVETLTMSECEETIYLTGTEQMFTLWAYLEPQGAYTAVTWSSSEESVLQVQPQDGNATCCNVCVVGEGEATITVTRENGMSVSRTFTVKKVPQLVLGEAVELNLEAGGGRSISCPFRRAATITCATVTGKWMATCTAFP